ncbi:MAG: hypothetical protein ACO3FE_21855 [Planctomycetaceae bacterium]
MELKGPLEKSKTWHDAMRLMKKHQRSFVSLLTAFSFVVVAVTGILAFVRPFSIGVLGCTR